MDFRNAPKKRTTNFREDETKLLIQLWGSPTVQNKLYLTHRKAPVMRLIAFNMAKHGFRRTPDEIKTRIRNLKCLYHRIKKSMATGTGLGTVDPDWPHYKAMDDILSRKNALRQSLVYNQNLLSEVCQTDIKEEIEDIELDDAESNTSNSNCSDDEFEENPSLMPATITPTIIEEPDKIILPIKIAPKPSPVPPLSVPMTTVAASTTTTTSTTAPSFPRIQIAQNLLTAPPHRGQTQNGPPPATIMTSPAAKMVMGTGKGKGNMPFPLLILQPNGAAQNGIQKTGLTATSNHGTGHGAGVFKVTGGVNNNNNNEVSSLLKEMLLVQKEHLEIERERLQVERQKLEYERAVGSHLLNMVPALNDMFQKFSKTSEPEDTKFFPEHPKYGTKRKPEEDDPLKDTKVYKQTVIDGIIKKYMNEDTGNNNNDSGISTSDSS
ncbi:uncharacterized protein LOC126746935 [Anthonomus grandis grandis]|uniref:uncharacterized protein LOC126746935 n=1 Tax=Anthonomus grandis grandis TaxID=2921223 RepID=UPI002165EBBE|nr:uncharacterized protein LOC126746935 [Anthonomus grandis grandis]